MGVAISAIIRETLGTCSTVGVVVGVTSVGTVAVSGAASTGELEDSGTDTSGELPDDLMLMSAYW